MGAVVLSVSSKEAHISRDHFFLSPDLHELWHCVMTTVLFTDIQQQWATLVLGQVTASVHFSVDACKNLTSKLLDLLQIFIFLIPPDPTYMESL